MKYEPRNQKLLVQGDPIAERTESGLIIPKDDSIPFRTGEILAVSPGVMQDGNLIVSEYSAGECLVYLTARAIKLPGEDLFLVDEKDVLAILTE